MLDRVVSRMSLPLLQVAVGFVVAALVPGMSLVGIDSEAFMLLLLAPLLYRDAREADFAAVWSMKDPVLSLAIGLVLASVLAVGGVVHLLDPAVPLAAAFALAAALAPTDAAAVGALGSTVSMTRRQSVLLSGEALMNDASGVVAFHFAVAAAVTGSFSAVAAAGEFARLFLGGIVGGALLGLALAWLSGAARARGLVSVTGRVLFEVFTPLLTYSLAEAAGVSEILAVVACGVAMSAAERAARPVMPSSAAARGDVASADVWQVLAFLINGVLFVMLGMQLPRVVTPAAFGDGYTTAFLAGLALATAAASLAVRFLWVLGMDAAGRMKGGWRARVRDAATMAVAGPKGAVTLSIILTLPLLTDAGSAFPARDLLTFLAAAVIVITLLLADWALPHLAKVPDGAEHRQMDVARARREVLGSVATGLERDAASQADTAMRAALLSAASQYRRRLAAARAGDATAAQMRAERAHAAGVKMAALPQAASQLGARERVIAAKARALAHEARGRRPDRPTFRELLARARDRGGRADGAAGLSASERRELAMLDAALRRRSIDEGRRRVRGLSGGEKAACLSVTESERAALSRDRAATAPDDGRGQERFMTTEAMTAALDAELSEIARLLGDGEIGAATADRLRRDAHAVQMSMAG